MQLYTVLLAMGAAYIVGQEVRCMGGWRSARERWLAWAVAAVLVVGAGVTATAWVRAAGQPPQAVPGVETAEPTPPQPTAEPLPLTGWVIMVDPGHGGYDGGARARDSGTWEKHINLAVSLEVEKSLVQRGATVVMTRREDEDLCEEDRPATLTKKRQDMVNRVQIAKDHQAAMVLSIHMNEYRSRGESGPQVFYRAQCDAGRLLAGCVQDALIRVLQPRKERAALAGDYFILQLEVPSVLVECGFISNSAEEKQLLTPAYQQRLAEAIALGVEEYVSLRPHETQAPEQTPPAAAQ